MSIQDATAQKPPFTALSQASILDATERSLSQVGYDGTTIRKIASMLGCAVGSIYRYFEDKRQLLSTVAQQKMEPAAQVIEAGGSFEQSVRIYVEAALAAPQTYRMMFWLACVQQNDRPAQAALPKVIERIIVGWGRRLGEAQLARNAWAVLHGSIMLGYASEPTVDAVRAVLNGQHVRTVAPPRPLPTAGPVVVNIPSAARLETATIEQGMAEASLVEHETSDDVCLL